MKIAWDPPKRLANMARHGLDFATLTEEFFANALVLSAKRGRYQAIGMTQICVVFAVLGLEGVSVISIRPASLRERKLLNAKS